MKILMLTILITIPITSYSKNYKVSELHSMIKKKKYPNQGQPQTQTKSIDYSNCLQMISSTLESFGNTLPTEVIVDNGQIFGRKIWTNDSSIFLTCSKPDHKLTVVTSPYI